MRDNVNLLKLIQIGFCLSDEEGNVPEKGLVWQFNFKFDIKYRKKSGTNSSTRTRSTCSRSPASTSTVCSSRAATTCSSPR